MIKKYKETRRSSFRRHGSISIFLCLLLSGLVIIESVLVAGAAVRADEAEQLRSARVLLSTTLAAYDRDFLSSYGLYVIDEDRLTDDVFRACYAGSLNPECRIVGTDALKPEQLGEAVSDYLLARSPAIAGEEILTRVSAISDLLKESDLFQLGSGTSGQALDTLRDFLGEKERWSGIITQAAGVLEEVLPESAVNQVTSFLNQVKTSSAQRAALLFEGSYEPGEALDPKILSDSWKNIDAIFSADMPQIGENYYLSIYAARFLDCQIKNTEEAGDKNLLGASFAKIHEANRLDLEYVITGIDNEIISEYLVRSTLYNVRNVIHFVTYLTDQEKREKALEIARVLEVCIAIISGGTVDLKAEALEYIVLAVWAQIAAATDVLNLADGQTIDLFPHSLLDKHKELGDFLKVDLRDCLFMFLLFIPQSFKEDRIFKILLRDSSSSLYTGAEVHITSRFTDFYMEEKYRAYR